MYIYAIQAGDFRTEKKDFIEVIGSSNKMLMNESLGGAFSFLISD